MPDFRYQSLTRGGDARNGVVAALDQSEAVRLLSARGETATVLEPIGAEPGSGRTGPTPRAPPVSHWAAWEGAVRARGPGLGLRPWPEYFSPPWQPAAGVRLLSGCRGGQRHRYGHLSPQQDR